MHNIHSVLGFGKHKNRPIWVVAICNPTYLDWCIKTINSFCIENLEELEALPFYNSFIENPDITNKMREKVAANPELFQSKSIEPQFIEDYFTEKGYDFYLEHFKPILYKCHKFSQDIIGLNNKNLEKQRLQEARENLRDNSWNESENYTFYDTINNAFECDYSNHSNID